MEIKLLKPHTHDGVEYKPGDILELDDELGSWLIRNKIAKTLDSRLHGNDVIPAEAGIQKKKKGGKK